MTNNTARKKILNIKEEYRSAFVDRVTELIDFAVFIDVKSGKAGVFSWDILAEFLPTEKEFNFEKATKECAKMLVIESDLKRFIDDLKIDKLVESIDRGESTSGRYTMLIPNIGVRHKTFKYYFSDDKREQIILMMFDCTKEYEEQEQKEKAVFNALAVAEQANAVKKEFLSRMSHELRTPMNAIFGYATIAEQKYDQPDEVLNCISKIKISTRFLLAMVNDIIDLARLESGKLSLDLAPIDFTKFIDKVAAWAGSEARAKNVSFEAIYDGKFDRNYMIDENKLKQILEGVLSNAIKFTPAGGKVHCIIKRLRNYKNEAIITFTVRDTGKGISEEFLPKLFEPFSQEDINVTSDYQGIGLGLPICKNLVTLMNGKIDVNSRVGVGSEFTVEVRLGIIDEIPEELTDAKPSYKGVSAIIADSDELSLMRGRGLLEELDIAVSSVDSRAALIKALKEGNAPELIFIDDAIRYSDDLGVDVLTVIRKAGLATDSKIIITGILTREQENAAITAGAHFCIHKPIYSSALLIAIDKTIGAGAKSVSGKLNDYNFLGKRILLVEDNEMNVDVVCQLLSAKKMAVEVAGNGIKAIEMFAMNPAGYYDAVLMDIRMPIMDGLTAAKGMRGLDKADSSTIPIIALTANAFDEDIEKSRASGMNEHLVKPLDAEILYEKLNEYVIKRKK